MGIEEWVFHFLGLMEKMTKISSFPSVRVKIKVIELEDRSPIIVLFKMEYIIESSLDSHFSMGIEEWVFHFLWLMEKMKKISSFPSVRVKSKVIELEDSDRQL
jgi:hypothetical protein